MNGCWKTGRSGKRRLLCLIIAGAVLLAGCGGQPAGDGTEEDVNSVVLDEEVLAEAQGCFRFLWEQAQTDKESGAYGLVRDRYPGAKNVSSIAATGFALAGRFWSTGTASSFVWTSGQLPGDSGKICAQNCRAPNCQ